MSPRASFDPGTRLPVARVPVRMNDAKHHNAVRRFAKINSIGKLPENRPAYSPRTSGKADDRSAMRCRSSSKAWAKTCAEPGLLLFIPITRLSELRLRLGAEKRSAACSLLVVELPLKLGPRNCRFGMSNVFRPTTIKFGQVFLAKLEFGVPLVVGQARPKRNCEFGAVAGGAVSAILRIRRRS
jgi:hypothetical protein